MRQTPSEVEWSIVAMTTGEVEWTEDLWNLAFIQWLENGRKPLNDDDIKQLQSVFSGGKKVVFIRQPPDMDELIKSLEDKIGMSFNDFLAGKSKNKARNTMNPEGTIELKATDDVSQSTDAVCEIVRILTRFRSRDERRNIMNAVAAFCIDDR